MAEINTGDGEAKKGKPKKQNLRVDMTPMVDMNMLLITFFMFCTTLSKPQMMNLVVPTKDKIENPDEGTKIDVDRTVTLILDENDIVYYYFGLPNYEDYTSLHQTDYSPNGLRKMVVESNSKAVREMVQLRDLRQKKQITDEEYRTRSTEIRDAKDGLAVVIKPTDASTYKNLVAVLDEMQICAVGKYAIVDITEGDKFLVQNLKERGALTEQAAKLAGN